MNHIHNNGENDKSFNDGLDKLSRAYGRLHQDEPPGLLDQAVLNSAHRALEKKPHWMKFGWLHGLTTAAVFVLAFSLILNQPELAPVKESGVNHNESADLKFEKPAKKQAPDGRSDDSRLEMKVKHENRQNQTQNIPVTTGSVSATNETIRGGFDAEQQVETQPTSFARDILVGKSTKVDNDATITAPLQEEMFRDEGGLMTKAAETGARSRQSLAATPAAVEPEMDELSAQTTTDSDAEQELLIIIRLKQSGDEKWETELVSFIEKYPDYPLPDALSKH